MEQEHIESPEILGEFVESLESCQELISSGSPVRSKLALILLDHLGEVLMGSRCAKLFGHDEFISKVIPPDYSPKKKAKVRRYFDEKVNLLRKENHISTSQAVVLHLGHSYRNAAQHKNQHNPAANEIIARVLFEAVCGLLGMAYDTGVMEGGVSYQVEWLARFRLPTGRLDYRQAAVRISEELSKKITPSPYDAKAVLSADIETRLTALDELVKTGLPSSKAEDLDKLLKKGEFNRQFDHEAASKSYREAIYCIGKGEDFPREEFVKREQEFHKVMAEAFSAFVPELSWKKVLNIRDSLRGLREDSQPLGVILGKYHEMDSILCQAEHHLDEAARAFESAVQLEVDIRRGK